MNSKVVQVFLLLMLFVCVKSAHGSYVSQQNDRHEFLQEQEEAAKKYELQRYQRKCESQQKSQCVMQQFCEPILQSTSSYTPPAQLYQDSNLSAWEEELWPRDSLELKKKKNVTLLQVASNFFKYVVDGAEK